MVEMIEDVEPIAEALQEIAEAPAPTVQMVRGDVTAAVAPQDVDGFKSAGYSVVEQSTNFTGSVGRQLRRSRKWH